MKTRREVLGLERVGWGEGFYHQDSVRVLVQSDYSLIC